MTITLNTEPETFAEASLSIAQILERKRWSFPLLIVKINGVLVAREQYARSSVSDGDAVEAYHLVSGG